MIAALGRPVVPDVYIYSRRSWYPVFWVASGGEDGASSIRVVRFFSSSPIVSLFETGLHRYNAMLDVKLDETSFTAEQEPNNFSITMSQ